MIAILAVSSAVSKACESTLATFQVVLPQLLPGAQSDALRR